MNNIQTAIVGGGCFWCTEAVFQAVKGVVSVTSGYSGGNVPGKPTYREVCSGLTGHAEVVQITFDTRIISYEEVLLIFMATHDPTSLNRQGADVGTEYRSVIFFSTNEEKSIAQAVIKELMPYYDNPIVTELSPLKIFYEAEGYHQNYFKNNPEHGYCNAVIMPKLKKLKTLFKEKLK